MRKQFASFLSWTHSEETNDRDLFLVCVIALSYVGKSDLMTKIPWDFRIQPDPNRDYIVAFTTGLAVDWWDFRKLFAFQRYTLRIVKELKQSKGCVGFALRAILRPPQGATLSVWEDIESLRYFQKENSHGEAVPLLRSNKKGKFQYVQWKCRGDAFPYTWEETEDQLKPKNN